MSISDLYSYMSVSVVFFFVVFEFFLLYALCVRTCEKINMCRLWKKKEIKRNFLWNFNFMLIISKQFKWIFASKETPQIYSLIKCYSRSIFVIYIRQENECSFLAIQKMARLFLIRRNKISWIFSSLFDENNKPMFSFSLRKTNPSDFSTT